MEKITALDWGVYYHFRFVANHHPELLPIVQAAYYVSSYVAVGVVVLLAAFLFLLQGKRRSALVVLTTFALAILLIEGVRGLVPSTRPPDAQNWLGPDAMSGTYPSCGVFMFQLGATLLGFAVWSRVRSFGWRALYTVVASLLTVWICLSEFCLGIHFLTDVIGGIVGAALLSWNALRCIQGDMAASRAP